MKSLGFTHAVWRCLVPALLGAGVAACTGSLSGGGSDGVGSPDPNNPASGAAGGRVTTPGGAGNGGPSTSNPPPPGVESAGVMAIRRLTRDQYDLTVRDLLGDQTSPAQAFTKDAKASSGFYETGITSEMDVRTFGQVAETVAAAAVQRNVDLTTCKGGDERACFKTFYESFGRRAFRRPLTAEDRMRFDTLYTNAHDTQKLDYSNTVRLAIQAALQAPSFLYRWELGGTKPKVENGLVKLTPHELAARLSYFLWNTMPDATLSEAADSGALSTVAQVEAQARRMLADPKAKATIETFHEQWLDLDRVTESPKDPALYPTFTPELALAMKSEARAFVDHVTFERNGAIDALLTAPVSFIDAKLGAVYGVNGVTGTTAQKKENVAHRIGLLTQSSFLSSHAFTYDANPITRGMAVFKRVLCGQIERPNFPIPEPKPLKDGVSNRERFSEHATDPQCAACHKHFDALGFAFESYGAIGEYRTKSSGVTVNTTGKLLLPSGGDIPFANAEELVTAIAKSDDYRNCVAKQWGRFALGRQETADDAVSLQNAAAQLQSSKLDVRELLVALAKSKTFMNRKPFAEEVSP